MTFKEVVKCTILEYEILISDAITSEHNQPTDEDDEFPANIWHVGCNVLT